MSEYLNIMLPDEVLIEQEYLISRRVRSLALIGQCDNQEDSMLKIVTKLESISSGDAIPFVVDREDGIADYGYATHRWVIDVYKLTIEKCSPIPEKDKGCIIGLLLGYDSESIARFKETANGRIIRRRKEVRDE